MRIFAHRGVSAEFPENTLPAFQRAIDLGCDGVELDVWLSRDGVPAVIHDQTVDRTTDGSGRIAELTMRELRLLDAGGGAGVPSLGEVLALAEGRIAVDIEIKDPHAAEAVLGELDSHPSADVFVSSFHEQVLHGLRRLSAEVELYPLAETEDFEACVDLAVALGAPGVAIDEAGLTAERIAGIGVYSLEVLAWTVNDPRRALELERAGVGAICTDDPRAMLAAVLDRGRA